MNDLIKGRAYRHQGMYVFELLPAGRKKAKGLFVCLHGFPAWSTKNYDIAEQLCLLGYAVLLPHYPGLGFSGGSFSFTRSRETLEKFLGFSKRRYGLPLSLMGHSWGGYLALALCRRVDRLLLLLAPLSVFPTGAALGALIDGIFADSPEDCRLYTKATMRDAIRSLGAAFSLEGFVETAACKPCLIVHGKDDSVIPVQDSRALAAKAAGKAKLIELEDGHLLYRQRRKVLDLVSQWIRAHDSEPRRRL